MPDHSRTRCLGVDIAAPVEDRYFEDYVPGGVYDYGTVALSETEIIDFGRQFDPQPFHIDAAAAAASPFGGIIASGWHTASTCMRLYADHYLSHVASLASPGLDELRWPRPVRPGDELHLRANIVSARVSASKPDRGIVQTRAEMWCADELVMTFTALNFLRRRDA